MSRMICSQKSNDNFCTLQAIELVLLIKTLFKQPGCLKSNKLFEELQVV